MVIPTKWLTALTLSVWAAHAHPVSIDTKPAAASFGPNFDLGKTSVYGAGEHAADAVFRLQLGESYTSAEAPGDAHRPEEQTPFYDWYIVGINMFAPAAYWGWAAGLATLAVLARMKRLRFDSSRELVCAICQSDDLRRISLGTGVKADLRRTFGYQAFRCARCKSRVYRKGRIFRKEREISAVSELHKPA